MTIQLSGVCRSSRGQATVWLELERWRGHRGTADSARAWRGGNTSVVPINKLLEYTKRVFRRVSNPRYATP